MGISISRGCREKGECGSTWGEAVGVAVVVVVVVVRYVQRVRGSLPAETS